MSTPASPVTADKQIAFVQASWHKEIVDRARLSYIDEISQHGYAVSQIDVYDVPGAFEIPLHAKRLAETGRYAAIVAAALVVDGGIYRHEFVATAVVDGLMRVGLDTGVPVISSVLTPHHFHEHEEHLRYFGEHFVTKGAEAARATVRTIASLDQIS